MMLDLEKIVKAAAFYENAPDGQYDQEAALALLAGVVMMRRGWAMEYSANTKTWYISLKLRWIADGALWNELSGKQWDDPFTGLLEADKWYRENVENKQ